MPTELNSALSIREILMRLTSHGDLTTKGSDLANTEVDNNFIIIYETIKSIYTGTGVPAYGASITYSQDDIVIESDIVYLSLQNANTGNTPGVGGSETFWGLCSVGDMLKILFGRTVKSGITAAGTNQATATILNKRINRIDTVAAGTGVVNECAEISGDERTVQNGGENDLNYYPFLGSNFYTLEGGAYATNTPFVIAPGNQLR